jgi:hypothetical protein
MVSERNQAYIERFSFLTPESKRNVERIFNALDQIAVAAKQRKDITLFDKQNMLIAIAVKKIKEFCASEYNDPDLWEQVPEVQKLLGGTLEKRRDITDEQFRSIQVMAEDAIEELEALGLVKS